MGRGRDASIKSKLIQERGHKGITVISRYSVDFGSHSKSTFYQNLHFFKVAGKDEKGKDNIIKYNSKVNIYCKLHKCYESKIQILNIIF